MVRERFDEARCRRRIAEGRPNLVDRLAEALIEIDEGSLWPQSRLQLGAGDDVAGLFEKRRQEFKRLVFQLDPDAVFPQLPHLELDFENTKSDLIISICHFHAEA